MKAAVVLTYISSLKKKSTNLLNPLIDFLINTINNSHVIPPEKASACVENCVEVVCIRARHTGVLWRVTKRGQTKSIPWKCGRENTKNKKMYKENHVMVNASYVIGCNSHKLARKL